MGTAVRDVELVPVGDFASARRGASEIAAFAAGSPLPPVAFAFYARGGCYDLALALHESRGFPLELFIRGGTPTHCYAVDGGSALTCQRGDGELSGAPGAPGVPRCDEVAFHAVFLDDGNAVRFSNDALITLLVARKDYKPRRVCPNCLVLLASEPDDPRAALVLALAEVRRPPIVHPELRRLRLEMFVGVSEDRLVLCGSLD
jgi:hypothetical protein